MKDCPVIRTLVAFGVAVFAVEGLMARQIAHLPEHLALQLGASYGLATVGESRWETLVTACFLHDGPIHLLLNMWILGLAGPLAERAVGSARIAPMVLAAGALGNATTVVHDWVTRSGAVTVGASGAISGLLAAGFVAGWRSQGWRGPLTRVMARWLALVLGLSLLSLWTTARSSHAAHLGGAVTGAVIALFWRLDRPYSARATRAVLTGCVAAVAVTVGVVAFHDRTDPFAALGLQERFEVTHEALALGRCSEAWGGLMAVERLRATMAPVTSLRSSVEETCGHAAR